MIRLGTGGGMKKILMVVHSYYKEDTRVRREAEALTDHGMGVHVICLNAGGEPRNENFNGVEIRRIDVARSTSRGKLDYILEYVRFFFGAFWQAGKLAIQNRYDVFFAHNMPNFLIFAGLVPRLRGARLVLDMHDSMPELYTNIFGLKDGWLKRCLYLEEKISNAMASARMTANLPIADMLRKRNGTDYFVMHNTPDHKVLSVEKRHKAKGDVFKLFHHGNIHQRYGLDRILPVMKSLHDSAPEVRLEVHGKGPWYDSVKAIAREEGVEALCDFHGAFAPEVIGRHLASADLGLVLNRKDDLTDLLLPVKMLEYISCKIPVVCPRTAAVEAYFDDGQIYYFDDDDHLASIIRTIVAQPDEAKEKAERAFQRYREFCWETEKQKFVSFVAAL